MMRRTVPVWSTLLVMLCGGCFAWHGSSGGGQVKAPQGRHVDPGDVAVPTGYRVEADGPGAMPAFDKQRLSDTELDDIVAYLKAMRELPSVVTTSRS